MKATYNGTFDLSNGFTTTYTLYTASSKNLARNVKDYLGVGIGNITAVVRPASTQDALYLVIKVNGTIVATSANPFFDSSFDGWNDAKDGPANIESFTANALKNYKFVLSYIPETKTITYSVLKNGVTQGEVSYVDNSSAVSVSNAVVFLTHENAWGVHAYYTDFLLEGREAPELPEVHVHTAGNEVVENNVAADCDTAGSYDKVVYCSECNAEMSRVTVTVNALGHNYKADVTAPDCVNGGYTTYTCAVCGDSYVGDKTNALGHSWSAWKITTEATSTTAGIKTRVCGLCGAEETMEYNASAEGTSGDTTWRLDNGTLYIEGAGAMADYVNTGKTAPWKDLYREITAIVIGDEVTYIGNRAFKGLNKVTSAVIGSAVATTGYECFYGCTALVDVEVKTEVLTYIGALCFYNCAFDSFEIPSTVTNIANRAFKLCKNLTSVAMPNAVTTTGYEVFMGCAALETATISTGLNMINPLVFQDCVSLKSVYVPANIIRVRNSAFANCTALEVVDFEDDDALTASSTGDPTIASNAFANCANLTLKGWMNGTVNDYAVQRSINFVAKNTSAFKYTKDDDNNATITGMRGNSTKLIIPATVDGYTVIAIGEAAFRDNTTVTSIELPETVETIGRRAFQGCTALTTINIPAAVTAISSNTFNGCSSLGEIYVPNTVTSVNNASSFTGCVNAVIKTQAGSAAATAAAAQGIAVKIVTNFEYTVNEDGESVTVTGLLDANATELVIPDEINGYKVTAINARAFKGNTTLESVTIGNNITELKYEIFQNCTSIKNVVVGSGVTKIGANTFGGMTALESITFLSDSINFNANTFANTPTTAVVNGVAGSNVETFVTGKGFTFVAL